ncbi:hypothetical protein F3Y22_tig00112800pilonHSYRG00104 [Hibiscus syriacus]|uniref:PPM-type phosphatase domain-containing protein n=1 Tax=Hibiscus syriacus TaxID=106335 RepID=A0A6A2XZL9_HIBSY|nr:hypothetical protein F3Y22_tig00112800pilonHSYRG00104 [Hibiscus syriacus]
MGICISVASSEIHDEAEEHYSLENVVYLPENIGSFGIQRLGSLYSKQGSKGLDQDAAILYQDYGIEGGAFCGVFDGHGKNSHIVNNMVRYRLPSLLLSQKIALAKLKTTAGKDGGTAPSKDFLRLAPVRSRCCTRNLDCATSGTTAVVVIRQARGEDLVIANLGDSRVVLGTMTENGIKGVQLTTDLKPGLPSESEDKELQGQGACVEGRTTYPASVAVP